MPTRQQRGHTWTVVSLLAVIAAMGGLAYYAVPLYGLFRSVTGYGGTPQRAEAAPGAVSTRTFTIRFNADVAANLPWKVRPVVGQNEVRAGAEKRAWYRASSVTNRSTISTVAFNVTPAKAGRYFVKIACFCFTKLQLAAGQVEDLPVIFFLDPAILKDRNLRNVKTITLSYTFFLASPPKPAKSTAAGGAASNVKFAYKRTNP